MLGVLLALQRVDSESREVLLAVKQFKFTLLKSDFITNALRAFLKILGILTGNILIESVFRTAMGGIDWKAPIT